MKRDGHKSGWEYRLERVTRRSFTLWTTYIAPNGEHIARGTPITREDLDAICKAKGTKVG